MAAEKTLEDMRSIEYTIPYADNPANFKSVQFRKTTRALPLEQQCTLRLLTVSSFEDFSSHHRSNRSSTNRHAQFSALERNYNSNSLPQFPALEPSDVDIKVFSAVDDNPVDFVQYSVDRVWDHFKIIIFLPTVQYLRIIIVELRASCGDNICRIFIASI